jgi:hypothetical protein
MVANVTEKEGETINFAVSFLYFFPIKKYHPRSFHFLIKFYFQIKLSLRQQVRWRTRMDTPARASGLTERGTDGWSSPIPGTTRTEVALYQSFPITKLLHIWSTEQFLASAELLTPHPLSPQRVCPPPAPKAVRGWGVNTSEDAIGLASYSIFPLHFHSWILTKLQLTNSKTDISGFFAHF